MKIARAMALPCAFILISFTGLAIAGGNVFRGTDSTETGFSTWDADAINIENVTETGHGVYVAVLDTGLAPNYRDYFPAARIDARLGKGFYQNVSFKAGNDQCGFGVTVGPLIETTFIGSIGSEHGTHVTSTILGFNYRANFDAFSGFEIPPIQVRGIAPEVTVIPVKVLADYQVPALPNCPDGATPAQRVVFGTSEMVAAGIDYVTDLAIAGHRPMVINMSLGGGALEPVEQAALDRAIDAGVIIVASAGNSGNAGMGFPAAYPPVISVAAAGWNNTFQTPDGVNFPYRMYWLKNGSTFVPPLLADGGEVPEPTPTTGAAFFDGGVYIIGFSSRELPGQELDITAPGVLIRGPFPGFPSYNHLPWWAKGIGDLVSRGKASLGNFFYVSGTSMASPHVAAVAALMMQHDPTLTQAEVENILKATALPMPPGFGGNNIVGFQSWGADATGAGLVQADAAVAAAFGEVTYDFTQTFGNIEVSGTLTYSGIFPASITVEDLNNGATWDLSFSTTVPVPGPFPLDPFSLSDSDSSWNVGLLPGTTLQIEVSVTELVFDLTTPLGTNAGMALASDLPGNFSQFGLGQLNVLPGFESTEVFIQAVMDPSVESFFLPFDTNLSFPAISVP